jgi:protein-tyrosine phosphatase
LPTKIYWIHTFDNGAKIGIAARPRGESWLEDEITHFKKNKTAVLVSLLESNEILELKLESEGEICNRSGIEFINFPIPDREIPKDKHKINQLLEILVAKINSGLTVVIHCRMGIGRSSIIAGAVLIRYNQKPVEIIQNISKIRGLKVPDTKEQIDWLMSFDK